MSDLHSEYYKKHYWNIHYKGLLGFFTNGYHQKLEKKLSSFHYPTVLEVGGGTGEHLKFVRHSFETYSLLDKSENNEGFLNVKLDPREARIKFIFANASEMPLMDNNFDRVLVTCVLHHIDNLEGALLEIRRVAKHGSRIDLYVPCDPGMVYRWVRHWVSHFKQKKVMNLSWLEVKNLWALEHRNHYLGIVFLIRTIFKNDKMHIERYPWKFFSWNFNLYSIVRITISK